MKGGLIGARELDTTQEKSFKVDFNFKEIGNGKPLKCFDASSVPAVHLTRLLTNASERTNFGFRCRCRRRIIMLKFC